MSSFFRSRKKNEEINEESPSSTSRFSLRDRFKSQAPDERDRDRGKAVANDEGFETQASSSRATNGRSVKSAGRTGGRPEPMSFLSGTPVDDEFSSNKAKPIRASVQRAMDAELEELEEMEAQNEADSIRFNTGASSKASGRKPSGAVLDSKFSSKGRSYQVRGNPAFEHDAPKSNQWAQDSDSSGEDSPDVLVRRADQAVPRPVGLRGSLGRVALDNMAQRALFLNTPSAQDKLVQCFVRREKDRTGLYPRFTLTLSDSEQFLLAARRRKKSQTSNYLISLDQDDLARGGAGFHSKLRSNYMGTSYALYNNGLKPGKGVSEAEERQELAAVLFKPTALELKGGPRKMTVVLPFPESFNSRLNIPRDLTLAKRWKNQKKGKQVTVIALQNKKPVWDSVTKGYCLDFRGRVTEPSVKNFQLVPCSGEDSHRVVLQFGKCGPDSFALDFSHPLTPLQAFGIALTSVDGKLCYSV